MLAAMRKCDCGCADVPPHGACSTWERGRNGRCVYCDHAGPCHVAWETSERVERLMRRKPEAPAR